MRQHVGQHAIVIGGSMAGLMTARVLADHFKQVTVLERDRIEDGPALHKSVPHGHHLHTLLRGGQQVLSALYPGFTDKLETLGAVRCRVGRELVFYLPDGKAYSVTGAVRTPRDLGFDIYCQSRGLLEYCVRQCTRALPNVTLETESTVQGLLHAQGRVHGVSCLHHGASASLDADLVIDTSGRGSRMPRWLAALGYAAPPETTIGVDLGYATTKFRIPTAYRGAEKVHIFSAPPPNFPSNAVLEEIEGGVWHVTMAGRFGDYPPTDADGFSRFARSLHHPALYEMIKDAERVTDIVQYRFPTCVQRHYEQLGAFPERLLVLGDAICSFNPLYGQGMSAAALQVKALQQVLVQRAATTQGLTGLASSFFPRAAEAIFSPWTIAANNDLGFPKTHGPRPPDLEQAAMYFAAVDALAVDDVDVHRLMLEVFNLAQPLSALNAEPLQSRVLEILLKTPQRKAIEA